MVEREIDEWELREGWVVVKAEVWSAMQRRRSSAVAREKYSGVVSGGGDDYYVGGI